MSKEKITTVDGMVFAAKRKTNIYLVHGYFDGLSIYDVRLLQNAAEHGPVFVLINSDDLNCGYNKEDRAELVAALESVACVAILETPTAANMKALTRARYFTEGL